MSQVKKLAKGGTFIIDGQELTGTDAINAVRPYLGETTGGIMNALQEGATVNYNSGNNTISIVDSNGKDRVYDYLPASVKASTMDSRLKKDFGATFHTKTDQFKRELSDLKRAYIAKPSTTETTPDLKALARGSGYFYTKDKDGKSIYLEGPENNNRLETIKAIRAYLEGDDDFRKGYKTEGWKQADLDALKNWVNNPTVSTDRDAYWKGLFDRIRGNNLSDIDKQTLNLMGFSEGVDNAGSDSSGNSNKPTIDKDWIGNREAAESAGIGIGKDSDGNWIIIGDNPYARDTWYARDMPFLKGTPFETGAIHNGRLYTEGDVFSGKYGDLSAAMAPFISAFRDEASDWNTRWNNAYNSGVKWYNMDNNIYANAGDPTKGYAQYWSRYFTDNNLSGNYNMIDVSNAFNNLGNRQVVSYIDGTTKNRYGIDEPIYLVRNEDNTITKYDNYNQLLANSGLTENPDIYGFAPKDITINPYQNIRGKDYAEYQRFGKDGQENTVLVGRDGYLYLDRGDAKPKRIYDIEKLKNILAGQAFENKDLDAITLTKGEYRWNLAAPFRQKRSQMINNESIRKNERNNSSLNKFQWGGSIQKVKSSAVSNDPSTKKHDYTKAHALDGSDGKLTSAEWMQIGAAVGDLAGVGISFVPGFGNIAGATTGAAASTTKFIADIKQDGYQRKDLGNYLANLGLDAATLIPGLGTGAKATKAAKIIKGVGKPIIKLLSATGAAAPVIIAVQKIQNGEKYTSEDLTTAIRGLGASFIAAKSMKDTIGEARLAKSVATKAAQSSNNITSNGITKTADEIASAINGKTRTEAAKELKTLFKNGESELSQSDAVKLLDDLNITWNKGKIQNWKFKNLGKNLTGGNRGHKTAELILQEPHSTFRYMVNPFTRSKVLGSEAVFGFGKNQGLLKDFVSPQTMAAANRLQSMPGRTPLKVQALNRIAAENPNLFGDMFTFEGKVVSPIIRQYGPYFGGTRYMRMAPVWTNLRPMKNPKAQGITDGLQDFSTNIVPSTLRDPNFVRRSKMIHDYALPASKTSYWNKNLWAAAMAEAYNPTFYRKGGKIVKAQPGTLIKYTDPEWVNPFDRTSSTSITSSSSMDGKTGSLTKTFSGLNFEPIDSNRFIYDPNYRLNLNPINKPSPQQNLNLPSFRNTVREPLISDVSPMAKYTVHTALKNAQKDALSNITNTDAISNAKIERPGGDHGKEWGINQANIADYIDTFGRVRRGINQDRDIQRRALGELYKRQFLTPEIDRAKYNFSDIEQGYNQTTSPYLEQKFVTSDARDSMAFKLNKAQQLSQLAGQKNAQVTQRQLQTDDTNRQIDTQNENARAQTANAVSQYLTNLNYQDDMLDSVRLNRWNAEGIGRLSQQMRQQLRDSQNKIATDTYNEELKKVINGENLRINSELRNKYGSAWSKLSNDEKNKYGDFQTYAYTQDPEWYKSLSEPLDGTVSKMQGIRNSLAQAMGAGFFYKSGGTINIRNTNKNQRSAQEQIAINGDKAAKRSVDELSRALLKMLQQLQAIK